MFPGLNHTRNRLLGGIAAVWVAAVAAIFAFTVGPAPADTQPEPVVVTHWASSHLVREGLLPEMAAQFNSAGHQTRSGRSIEVQVHNVPPFLQSEYLKVRVKEGRRLPMWEQSGIPIDSDIPDPTIVTPSSAHWFIQVNHEVGREVVDLRRARSIVRPFIGIVTYRAMAECLGWPEKELGYADILALRADPAGWSRYECARAEWGVRPLVAYTDPTTSSTGRSLLLGLYAIAAGKSPEELTLEDISDPEVVGYIKGFQDLIDFYSIGTTVLNTQIHRGPRFGHFFIMPENNLIALYNGTEEGYVDGRLVTAPPIPKGTMVMIYPKEGAMPRSNCACIVQAEWVTEEHDEAARQWIDFVLQEEQQRAFMAAGLRPGADIPISDPIGLENGLDPRTPSVIINPSLIDPVVAAAIDQSWEHVKRPGIVTFVVDSSVSMSGTKLEEAATGLERALNGMAPNNLVGLVTFNDRVTARIDVGALQANKGRIADTVREARTMGKSAMYDAIKTALEMTDKASSEEVKAIRGVVVLTDGKATSGATRLHDLIVMRLRSGSECRVIEDGNEAAGYQLVDECTGSPMAEKEVTGTRLAIATQNEIPIFFIGIGDDVDLEVGRLLAEATGAEYVGAPEDDLARVIQIFGKYF